jgi:hypothetical protein
MAFTGNYACDVFKVGLMDGVYNFGTGTSQTFKIALYTNSATLNASTTAYTATGETSGSGYTAGGQALTIIVPPTVGGSGDIAYLSFADEVWTASTITARGALIYLANGTTNPAVCVLDFGSDKSTTGGNFTVQFPSATNTSAIIRIS